MFTLRARSVGYIIREKEEAIEFYRNLLHESQQKCNSILDQEEELLKILEKFTKLGSYEYLKRLVEADKKEE